MNVYTTHNIDTNKQQPTHYTKQNRIQNEYTTVDCRRRKKKKEKKKNYNQFIVEEDEEVYYTLWKHKIDTDNTLFQNK